MNAVQWRGVAVGLGLSLIGWVCIAAADPKPGIWYQNKFDMEGVTIRKFYDNTQGASVVCYLAQSEWTGSQLYTYHSMSISCVPVK